MVTRSLSGRWLAVATVLGVLMAAALATLYGGLRREPAPPAPRPATGTVLESAPCARPGARDTVVFVVDGRSYRLPLDACGNPAGIVIDVELVITEDGEPAVRPAGTGPEPRNVVAERVGALLLALAALSGSLFAVLVSPRRARARPPEADDHHVSAAAVAKVRALGSSPWSCTG